MADKGTLISIRLRLGLTRKQAANLVGITPNQLFGLEVGAPEVMAMEKRVREVLEILEKQKKPG